MTLNWRSISLALLLIAAFLLAVAVLHHPSEPGPRFAEFLEARDLLVVNHIDSPDREQLTKAAWEGALREATRRGVDVTRWPRPSDFPSNGYENALSIMAGDREDRIRRGELLEAAISAMAASLNDLHTAYLRSADWKRAGRQVGARRYTPQFLYRAVRVPEGLLVWDVSAGSEAIRGGLLVADTITAINGASLSTGSTGNIVVRESNRFTVYRPNAGKVELTIKVEPEAMHPFEARMLGDIAYFRIYAFPPPDWHLDDDFYRVRLDNAIKSLAAEKPRGWILDLRGNRGGYAETVAIIAGALGVKARTSEHINRSGRRDVIYTKGPSLVSDSAVAVLTDRGTVSGGEILAFNLQESGARIFGTSTSGSVRGGRRFPLQRGGGLSISVDKVQVGIRGADLEGVGVIPDEDVRLDTELARQGRDSQLERALAWLAEAAKPGVAPLAR